MGTVGRHYYLGSQATRMRRGPLIKCPQGMGPVVTLASEVLRCNVVSDAGGRWGGFDHFVRVALSVRSAERAI